VLVSGCEDGREGKQVSWVANHSPVAGSILFARCLIVPGGMRKGRGGMGKEFRFWKSSLADTDAFVVFASLHANNISVLAAKR
jgi:hypothetical protein